MTPPPLLETTLVFLFKFDAMQKEIIISRLDARSASLPKGKKEVVG